MCNYHRPVCIKCKVELRCEETGVIVVDFTNENKRPYKAWSGDTWKCPICSTEIVVDFGRKGTNIDKPILSRLQERHKKGEQIVACYETIYPIPDKDTYGEL